MPPSPSRLTEPYPLGRCDRCRDCGLAGRTMSTARDPLLPDTTVRASSRRASGPTRQSGPPRGDTDEGLRDSGHRRPDGKCSRDALSIERHGCDMDRHLERALSFWLTSGLKGTGATSGRGWKQGRCRFEAVLLPRLEDRRLLSTFPVTSTADDGSPGTLRWAVAGADADTSPSTIVFELGTAAEGVTLTQGPLDLSNTSESVAIYEGPGEGPVTISGNGL